MDRPENYIVDGQWPNRNFTQEIGCKFGGDGFRINGMVYDCSFFVEAQTVWRPDILLDPYNINGPVTGVIFGVAETRVELTLLGKSSKHAVGYIFRQIDNQTCQWSIKGGKTILDYNAKVCEANFFDPNHWSGQLREVKQYWIIMRKYVKLTFLTLIIGRSYLRDVNQ